VSFLKQKTIVTTTIYAYNSSVPVRSPSPETVLKKNEKKNVSGVPKTKKVNITLLPRLTVCNFKVLVRNPSPEAVPKEK